MRQRRKLAATATAVALSMVVAACGSDSGSGGGSGSSGGGGSAAYDAASEGIVNKSDATGGTLKYVLSDAPDSMDPGDTYYAFNWNFTRLYARPLTTFKPAPGKAGLELVPDLAESLGEVSDDSESAILLSEAENRFFERKPFRKERPIGFLQCGNLLGRKSPPF